MKRVISCILLVFIMSSSSAFGANYTGMWWDPAKEGTGVFIEHLDIDNCICGAWYLYDEAGSPLWATFFGKISGSSLTSNLYTFTGPPFGSTWDSNKVKAQISGTVTFDFESDSSITMTYQLRGASGQLHLAFFSLAECPGWLWWDPEKPGQGVAMFPMGELGKNEQIAVVWYVYDTNGNPVWFTALGHATAALEVYRFSGPPLGQAWNTSKLQRQTVGSITIENIQAAVFTGHDIILPNNTMSYVVGGISGTLNLETFICSSLCE